MTSTLHWDVRNYMKDLRHGRLQVLLSLVLHSNIRGRSWPKTETLLEESGYNDKTLIAQAKDWLFEHKAFVYVPVDKRVGVEESLHNRHQVYQLTGFIEINGEIKPYLFVTPETETEMKEAVKAVMGDDEFQSRTSLLRDSLSSESLPHKVVQEESKDSTKIKEKDIAALPKVIEKTKTPRQRNPMYEAVALHVFSLDYFNEAHKPDIKASSGRIGKLVAYLAEKEGTPELVAQFKIWYMRKFPNINIPRDVAKFSGHYKDFLDSLQTPVQTMVSILKAPIRLSAEDERIRQQNEIALREKRAEWDAFNAKLKAEQAERGD